jgi:CBS domain containing-hemolysin-like protein
VFSLDGRRTVAQVLPELLNGTYSRIPLFGEDPNEILKVLFVRDLLEAVAAGTTDVPVLSIGRIPLFVPENQKIDQLLSLLRKNKQHMALVVDDTGYWQGVVTLEDLVEELVGEIYDELDELPEHYLTLPDDGILVDGDVELRVVEDFFAAELPGKPTDTVSRWILGHTARIPAADECFTLDGLEVHVKSASARRIHQVALTRSTASGERKLPANREA